MYEKLARMIGNKQSTYSENPYWKMKNGFIFDKQSKEPFNLMSVNQILPFLIGYFKLNYDSFKTESQVLVLSNEQYNKLDNKHIPELDLDGTNPLIHVLVLPQINTWGNTSVSELYWQNEIAAKGIVPLMRIHTHHVLPAYQSSTDWSSLNSGSLEVVVGKIYDDVPELAFWLDIRGTENKNFVFKSQDYGIHIEPIQSGKPLASSTSQHELLSTALKKRNQLESTDK